MKTETSIGVLEILGFTGAASDRHNALLRTLTLRKRGELVPVEVRLLKSRSPLGPIEIDPLIGIRLAHGIVDEVAIKLRKIRVKLNPRTFKSDIILHRIAQHHIAGPPAHTDIVVACHSGKHHLLARLQRQRIVLVFKQNDSVRRSPTRKRIFFGTIAGKGRTGAKQRHDKQEWYFHTINYIKKPAAETPRGDDMLKCSVPEIRTRS